MTTECIHVSDPDEYFIIAPTDQTVVQNGTASILCQHSRADSVGWILNNESITNSTNTEVESTSERLDGGGVLHILTIIATPKYNLSNIQCVASFFDGSRAQLTSAAQLLIQGLQECYWHFHVHILL